LSATLLIGMTGTSLHMQWPLTSQSHGSNACCSNFFFKTIWGYWVPRAVV
jgi:hypothetical protein